MSKLGNNTQGNAFRRINQLDTAQATDLLGKASWKELFSDRLERSFDQNVINSLQAPNYRAMNTLPHPQELKSYLSDIHGQSSYHSHAREKDCLSYFSSMLIARIEALWQEVNIPHSDRKFYRETMFRNASQSFDRCRDLSVYLSILQDHRMLIIAVMEAVTIRQHKLQDLDVFLRAEQMKLKNMGVVGVSHDARISDRVKEELISLLLELQSSAIDVIKRIQRWRKSCWRPHSFRVCDENYIYTIINDGRNLSEQHLLLELLSLTPFSSSHFPLLFMTSAGMHIDVGDTMSAVSSMVDSNMEDKMMNLYSSTINLSELKDAILVVREEERLQKALKSEIEALTGQSVFIPFLRS